MKIYTLTFCLFLIFYGCSQNAPTSPRDHNSSTGNLSLSIDKTTAPKNVVKVVAHLTRTNHDTRSAELNLLSNTTADISFGQVLTGTWHLKVDAIDSDSAVVYTGETDVEVKVGLITNVNLTLSPTGNGHGSIYIFVNWGTGALKWNDYSGNPVFTNSDSGNGANGIGNPYIIIDNGIYKMWFKYLENNGVGTIGYAESKNGISWATVGNGPVIKTGSQGSWDMGMVTPGPVIKEDGIYKMYYSGAVEAHLIGQIGLATSSDGIHWQKYPKPIIQAGSGWETSINANSLVKKDGVYYLYYVGLGSSNTLRQGLATSTDGINWKKYEGNPILSPTEGWEYKGSYYSSVIFENGIFKMVYMNNQTNDTGFGKAVSTDGIHWTKDSNNPYFTGTDTYNNWTFRPIYPFFIKVGNSYRVYYASTVTTNNKQAIGFLTFNQF